MSAMPPADRPLRQGSFALGACLLYGSPSSIRCSQAWSISRRTSRASSSGRRDRTPRITSNQVDSDAYLAEYPWQCPPGRELAAGHLPLWDPSRFAGVPFAADISVGTFYPPNWLYALGRRPSSPA